MFSACLQIRSQLAANDRARLMRLRLSVISLTAAVRDRRLRRAILNAWVLFSATAVISSLLLRAAALAARWRVRRVPRIAFSGWALATAWAAAAAQRHTPELAIAAPVPPVAESVSPPPDADNAGSTSRGTAMLPINNCDRLMSADGENMERQHTTALLSGPAHQSEGALQDDQHSLQGMENTVVADAAAGVGLLPAGLLPEAYARELMRVRLNRLSHHFLRGWCVEMCEHASDLVLSGCQLSYAIKMSTIRFA